MEVQIPRQAKVVDELKLTIAPDECYGLNDESSGPSEMFTQGYTEVSL